MGEGTDAYWEFDPFDPFFFRYVEEERPGIIAFVTGLIYTTVLAIVRGVFGFILNVIAAIIVPVLCPVVNLLAMWGFMELTEGNPVIMVVSGLICLLIVGFVYIGIPVISFRREQ